jgi:hypothetical protein
MPIFTSINTPDMHDWITEKVIRIVAEQADVAPERIRLEDTIYDYVDVLMYDEAEPLAASLAAGFQLSYDQIALKLGGIDLVSELVELIRKLLAA